MRGRKGRTDSVWEGERARGESEKLRARIEGKEKKRKTKKEKKDTV